MLRLGIESGFSLFGYFNLDFSRFDRDFNRIFFSFIFCNCFFKEGQRGLVDIVVFYCCLVEVIFFYRKLLEIFVFF